MTYHFIYASLFITSTSLLISCGGKKEDDKKNQPPPAVSVSIQPVRQAVAAYFDEYPATVAALNQIDLRSQVSGNITGIFFKDGDRVTKGQLLYTIDDQLYTANVQQAQAALRVQEANVNRAQKDANRYHELDRVDAVAKQLVDNADATLQVSQREADAARANIKALQTNVNYTRVYAPFTGTIGISQVKVGSPVAAGTTILNTVSADNPLAVDINIDQNEIYRFGMLQMKQDSLRAHNDSTFQLAFADEVYPAPGTIALLDRAVDPQTGTIRMRLVFPNDKGLLRAGMSGKVRVKNNANKESIVIPYKAVTEQLGEFYVYVVGDSNKVAQRQVSLGTQVDTSVIIKRGLQVGDTIVTQGMQNLKQGSVITTAPPKPQAAPKS